jgi:hypothetical protein
MGDADSVDSDDRDEHPFVVTHIVTSHVMQYAGLRLVGFTNRKIRKANPSKNYRRFKSQFGVSAATASRVYADLQTTSIVEARIQGSDLQLRFFFMGVYYLRKYPTEDDLEAKFNYSNFWAREKVWGTVKRIRALTEEKIYWDDEDGIGHFESMNVFICLYFLPAFVTKNIKRKLIVVLWSSLIELPITKSNLLICLQIN